MVLSEVFLTGLYTACIALILSMAALFYKSKCKTVRCCGICEIERDIETELKEDQLEMDRRRPSLD